MNKLIVASILLITPLIAQTKIDLANQSKNADFTAFAVVKPNPVGTVLPGTCAIGSLYFLQTAPGTGTLYSCTATNVWAAISGYSLPQATTTTLGGVTVPTGTGITVSSGNLGLTYGTAANTVTQGNDTRVVNALLKGNNLSDVTTPATALSNIGGVTSAQAAAAAPVQSVNGVTGNITILKVNGVNYPSAPSTNTLPVVTSSNQITYELIPNASLVNNALTVTAGTGLSGGGSVALGSTTTLSANFGTTSGTIAQGNDARFGNATSIQSNTVLAGAPSAGQAYLWNAGTNRFELGTPGGTGAGVGGADMSVQYANGGVFAGVINATATKSYLYQTNSAAPAFQAVPIPAADLALIPLTTGVSGTLPVANGGSGAATFTANGLLLGNGTSAFAQVGLGTTTTVLHGNAAGASTFGAVSLTADVSGALPIANGGTGQATAATAFNALSGWTTLGDIVYRGASNPTTLHGNITTTPKYLSSTGNGATAAAPVFGDVTAIQGNAVIAGTPSNGQGYFWNTGNSRFELSVPSGGGGGGSFSALTSGTNTVMTALVGTGASLGVTGSGTIAATSSTTATQLNGTGPFQMSGAVTTTPSNPAAGQGTCWFDSAADTYRCKDNVGIQSAMVMNATPASSTASCTPPQAAYDTNFYYVCTSLNTWKRTSVVTF